MKSKKVKVIPGILFLLALLAAPALLLADADEDRQREREAIERMRERYPQLLAAKGRERIGETWQGLVAAVPGKDADDSAEQKQQVAHLIRDENSDRQTLFGIWARRAGPEVDVKLVAERFRKRQYDLARPDHWVTDHQGTWVRRRDLKEPEKEPEEGQ